MEVFRISKKEFASPDGKGGLYYPGRWHRAGYPIIYAAESRSLATLETLVHLTNTMFLNANFVITTLKIPDSLKIQFVLEDSLPKDWSSQQQIGSTRDIGDNFLRKQKFLICKVPSAIIAQEFNYIINPLHPDFKHIELVKTIPFRFDSRLGQ